MCLMSTQPAFNQQRVACFVSLVGLVVFLFRPTSGLAQTGTSVIRGVVRDAKQAVVPDAHVVLVNQDTKVEQDVQSSEQGTYYIGALPRGLYTLTVAVTGFKKWSTKLELEVGQIATVDVGLELGDVETTLEVSDAAAPISAESTDVSDVKDFNRIRQLPLNGRS